MSAFRTLVALAFALAAVSMASAQTPAAPKCEKPDPHPGRLASQEKMRGWNKEIGAWQECMKKIIAEVQAKADVAVKAANAAVAESNAAVKEYNESVKEFQAQADAAR